MSAYLERLVTCSDSFTLWRTGLDSHTQCSTMLLTPRAQRLKWKLWIMWACASVCLKNQTKNILHIAEALSLVEHHVIPWELFKSDFKKQTNKQHLIMEPKLVSNSRLSYFTSWILQGSGYRYNSVVKHWSSVHKVLGSILNTTHTQTANNTQITGIFQPSLFQRATTLLFLIFPDRNNLEYSPHFCGYFWQL